MKIGILQTGHSPDALQDKHGNYPNLFERLLAGRGFDFDTYPVVDGVFPKSVDAADGWLITGSRFGAYEDHAWIPPLEDFIREAMARKVPMIGVCFGHQIIAQAMGGKVEKYHGGWSVGPTNYKFGDSEIKLNAWHQDQVTVVPKGAQVVASSGFCENAAMVYGDTAFTVQAHPEFTNDFVDDLIEKRGRGLVSDALLDAAKQQLGSPVATVTLADKMAAFFKQPRG